MLPVRTDSLRHLRAVMQLGTDRAQCLLQFNARPHLIDHLSIDPPRCLLGGLLTMDNPAHHLDDSTTPSRPTGA
eukprot:806251-Pyramimonas_sp.AAC.1